MSLDPLGRAHLLVSEAIELIVEDAKGHATHDPGVARAITKRLTEARAQLQEAAAGFSRMERRRVIREVSVEVALAILQLLIRATATHCNFKSNSTRTGSHAVRYNHSATAYGKRAFTSRARQTRQVVTVLPLPGRTRPTRTCTLGAASDRRGAPCAVWGGARCCVGRLR